MPISFVFPMSIKRFFPNIPLLQTQKVGLIFSRPLQKLLTTITRLNDPFFLCFPARFFYMVGIFWVGLDWDGGISIFFFGYLDTGEIFFVAIYNGALFFGFSWVLSVCLLWFTGRGRKGRVWM
ncbi:hypothetical protein BDD12DRAFT_824718, partial [Trichophaea hybrida]